MSDSAYMSDSVYMSDSASISDSASTSDSWENIQYHFWEALKLLSKSQPGTVRLHQTEITEIFTALSNMATNIRFNNQGSPIGGEEHEHAGMSSGPVGDQHPEVSVHICMVIFLPSDRNNPVRKSQQL